MRILFITRLDPKNKNAWSGTLYQIYAKLKEKHSVEIAGTDIIKQLRLFSKDSFSDDTFLLVDRYISKLNALLSERINFLDFDLVFFGDIFFSTLEIDIPLIYLSDMTYEQNNIHYKKDPEKRNFEPCINLEKILLNNAYRIIFSSEWIKQKAVEFYDLDAAKIEVVEFGANIPTPRNYTVEINTEICRLVFIGLDWERKGGDKLLQIYEILKKDGFPCTLTIIGSMQKEVPDTFEDLTVIPFLNKTKPADAEKLCKVLSESHFFVLPTRFDAFGIVFCEASAYALPSITADVGGVSQAVKDGKNGYLLPADATAEDYAEKIKSVFNDRESYLKLRKSSRKEFEARLNWDV